MRDPLFIDNSGIPLAERTDDLRRGYLQRSIDRLPADVIVAFDKLFALQREKDRIQSQLDKTKKKLDRANQKIWIMSLIVSPIVAALLRAIWERAFR